jgi:hypothetical protein
MAAGTGLPESSMEARIARLESDVAHIRTDVADIKIDVRTLTAKIENVKDSIGSAKIWALMLYIALAAALFGTLARGFGWL